ncbi:MAG: extracellular solute-binding protein [Candidatus Zixiibacteriota bacterium]|nr:MAG: extracellular solute-binding protein [candidate division Zixibacteria bacterium]
MKNVICFTVTALAAVLLSCSSGDRRSGVVTLDWWQFWTDPSVKPTIEQIVADFEAQNPGINISITDLTWANGHEKIVMAFASGTAPDIVELGSDWIPELSSAGKLADLTGDAAGDSADFSAWTPGTYDNQIYAFPWILGTRVLYINTVLMTRAGYDEDFVPFNWPQLKELCYKIDSLGKDMYGFGANAAEKHRLYKKFLPFLWSNGGSIMSRDGSFSTIASDKSYAALKFYKELCDSTGMVDTQRRLEDAFLEGKVGVIISGDWLLKRIRNEQHDIPFITALIPGPKFPGKSFVGGEYLAVSRQSKYKSAAIKFIRFLTSRDNQLLFCKANYTATPSSKTAAKDPFFAKDPQLQTFVKQLNLSKMPKVDQHWVYIEDVLETTLENVLYQGAPVAESLYEAKLEIEKIVSGQ